MSGNTTFLICCPDEQVDLVIEVCKKYSKKRKQFVPSSTIMEPDGAASYPVEVAIGGATIFVTDIARMSRQQSRDAEGVVPYNPEFTAYSKHRRTMFAPTSHSGKFLPPQNRSALCVSTLRLGLERRCRFNSPISLSSDILFLSAFDTTICTLSACAE